MSSNADTSFKYLRFLLAKDHAARKRYNLAFKAQTKPIS